MRIFVYKTLFVLVGLYILFYFTIGKTINHYEHSIKNLTNDQGREMIRNKIRSELKKASEKDTILKDEDKIILKKFITKIQKELND